MRHLVAAFLAAACVLPSSAANLDISSSYKMRALSYKNLNYTSDKDSENNASFISNDARFGVAARNISLETRGTEETTMDVAFTLHALGAAGSTTTLHSSPFDRIASNYPSVDFTPFIENAYIKVNHLFGYPLEATFGRQNFRLGSGLLLDDDGAGFTGVTVRAELPWWAIKTEAFVFADRATQQAAPNSLALFGLSVSLPTEGVWQINQLFERDRSREVVYGCSFQGMGPDGCMVSKALRSFTGVRYALNYGPIVFDGEAVLEKGAATPMSPDAANPAVPGHITYNGNAEVARAKWKQSLPRLGEGIARLSLARGSGDNAATKTTDEAFYPSHGHRFSGLERSGFGDLFAATPYDAFGGNYSSTTASGLSQGASGIIVVGAGYTPPAYHGVALDVDYYLYQAERISSGPRTLGMEWDLRLRYNIQDRFGLSASADYFAAGKATNPNGARSVKYALEAFGRF